MKTLKKYAYEMDEATELVKKAALKLNELENLKALMAQIEEDIFQVEHEMKHNGALLPLLENGGMTHNGWHFHAEQQGIGKSVYHEPCTKMSTIDSLKEVAA